MNDTILDLIEKRLDGTISESESVRLESACRDDTAVREALDDALLVDEMVSGLPEEDPPAALRARIMDALPDEPSWHRALAPDRGAREASRRTRGPRRRWSSLLVGAGGLTLGAALASLVFLIVSPVTMTDEGPASGTITAPDEDAVSEVTGELSSGGEFVVRTIRTGSLVRVQATGRAPAGAQIMISWSSEDVRLTGFEDRAAPGSQDGVGFESTSSSLRMAVNGPFSVVVRLTDERVDGSLRVQVGGDFGSAADEIIRY